MRQVTIVGTGLIGASLGLALKKAGFDGAIVGVSSPMALAAAVECGAIDRGAPLAEAVPAADLVFLSQAIGRILDTIRRLDPLVKPGALVTDAGSTKCEIVDLARQFLTRCQFLGGHPMAGKESRGAAAADAELFRGHPWALTPDQPNELETPAAREFRRWLERMGARIAVLDCDAHDRLVARTSHVPQLASTALAAVLEAQWQGAVPPLYGPGLKDMTRLALSSYDLWRDIVATNTDHIARALGDYIQELEHLRENLRTRQLQEEFGKGAAFATRLRHPGH
ncbi:MAG: prephenate dehydrogenase/arogenate dehydrogenase family protein [Bryobacteraceae bacterium]|jgi:prephenate dehydrogenase